MRTHTHARTRADAEGSDAASSLPCGVRAVRAGASSVSSCRLGLGSCSTEVVTLAMSSQGPRGDGARERRAAPRRPCALRGHPAPLLPTLGRQTSLCPAREDLPWTDGKQLVLGKGRRCISLSAPRGKRGIPEHN